MPIDIVSTADAGFAWMEELIWRLHETPSLLESCPRPVAQCLVEILHPTGVKPTALEQALGDSQLRDEGQTQPTRRLPQAALDRWVEYEPVGAKYEATRLRHAFMSGFLAASPNIAPASVGKDDATPTTPRDLLRKADDLLHEAIGDASLSEDERWHANKAHGLVHGAAAHLSPEDDIRQQARQESESAGKTRYTHRIRRDQYAPSPWCLFALDDQGRALLGALTTGATIDGLLRHAGGLLPSPEDVVQIVYAATDELSDRPFASEVGR